MIKKIVKGKKIIVDDDCSADEIKLVRKYYAGDKNKKR
jgi:hypothetical protein